MMVAEGREAQAYFQQLAAVQAQLPFDRIDRIARLIVAAQHRESAVFIFGNGGSAALAGHMVCDLAKGTAHLGGPRLRVAALTESSPLVTAWANDTNYSAIFAEQLANWARPADLAFAISCSGNSANVLRALEAARSLGMTTIGLGGFQGGRMRDLCDECVIVPSDHMQVIEDLHHAIAHSLFLTISKELATPRTHAASAS